MDASGTMVPAEFWGAKVAPKKTLSVGRSFQEDDQTLDTFHLSQVALGPDATPGRHVVWVEYEGVKSVIGSLTLGGIEQFQIDFPVNCEVKVSHTGKSDVYVTGYTTRQFLSYDDSSDDEEQQESSDDEELPLRGRGLANGASPADIAALQRRGLVQLGEESDEEDSGEEGESDDESDDEDEELPEGAPAGLPMHQFSDIDEDDSEGSDDDDGQPSAPGSGLGVAHGTKTLLEAASASESDDDDDEWGTDDEEGDDDDDEDEDEEEDAAAAAPKVGAKRPPATPASAKLQKKPKPADTPGTPSGGGAAQYQTDLVNFLKTNGATKLAVLGSQVKRAAGLPKMKKFLEDRPAQFKLDVQSGVVSLA